jgi:TorA maturation chaperone TorD
MKESARNTDLPKENEDALAVFRDAVAHDLLALALLHNEELSGELIAQLKAEEFPHSLQLQLTSDPGIEATQLFHQAVTLLGNDPDTELLDELAADYTGIYLTHALQASPYESVWIDEEGLIMQEPMFQIRAIYKRHGLAVQDWRKRSEDHLVLQLQFVSHLLTSDAGLHETARFLDEHLLRWLPDFGARVAARCATPLYAGLCAFTAAYMNEVRDLLADILAEARPTPEEIKQRMKTVTTVELPEPRYAPGSAPSW